MGESKLDGKCACVAKVLCIPCWDSPLSDRSSIGSLSVRQAGNLTDRTLDAADIFSFYSGEFRLSGGKQGKSVERILSAEGPTSVHVRCIRKSADSRR